MTFLHHQDHYQDSKMPTKEQRALRQQFIREFVRALIYHSGPILPKKSKMPSKEVEESPAPIIAPQEPQTSALEKIRELILDPTVQTIECPGPNKQIILSRAGRVQPINMYLVAEEINQVMDEFSKKTKIPLISGIFKAALGHLIVTAVISEYLGTKFIIQKRIPLPPSN